MYPLRYMCSSIFQVELCFGSLDAINAFGELVKVDINIVERVGPTM